MGKEMELKTKNHTLYFSLYSWLRDWSIPLSICVELISDDYTEIHISILCFTFEFISISKCRNKELDNMFKEKP